jgi:hypothetical protein
VLAAHAARYLSTTQPSLSASGSGSRSPSSRAGTTTTTTLNDNNSATETLVEELLEKYAEKESQEEEEFDLGKLLDRAKSDMSREEAVELVATIAANSSIPNIRGMIPQIVDKHFGHFESDEFLRDVERAAAEFSNAYISDLGALLNTTFCSQQR